jgi:hypothetical protein
MKILEFHQLIPPNTRGRSRSPSDGQKADGAAPFEEQLQKAQARPSGPIGKITSENLLASQGADLEDVGAAGSLLSSLVAAVKASKPSELQKVHDIDGILYYFQI